MDSKQTVVGFYRLNWQQLLTENPDNDNLYKMVVLNNRELSVALSCINIVKQPHSWGLKRDDPGWLDVLTFVEQLERNLMAVLSVDDLIKTNLMLWSAITGTTIDRDHPENYLSGELEPTPSVIEELGHIDGALGALQTSLREVLDDAVEELETVNTNLDNIRAAIAAQAAGNPEELADELSGIVQTISTVATILGAL